MFCFFKKNIFQEPTQRGFTLVELLVVFGIITIVTSGLLIRNSRFNDSIVLTNLAYDIALSIRQAQVFGLSVREDPTMPGDFSSAYGVFFDKQQPNTFVLFIDRDRNNAFTTGEDVEIFTLAGGNQITRLCVYLDESSSCAEVKFATALFERPNPDAIITGEGAPYGKLEVYVGDVDTGERTVVVRATGQIAVE